MKHMKHMKHLKHRKHIYDDQVFIVVLARLQPSLLVSFQMNVSALCFLFGFEQISNFMRFLVLAGRYMSGCVSPTKEFFCSNLYVLSSRESSSQNHFDSAYIFLTF